MCSEISPRVSFSHDLGQAEHNVTIQLNESRRDTMLLEMESCCHFEFNISFEQQSCSADELFANGMILPVVPAYASLPQRPKLCSSEDTKKESMGRHNDLQEKPQSKSFWGFKRSTSLNCEIKKTLICSLPLLSRSNSTGSVPNPKRSSSMIKDSNKHGSQKLFSTSMKKPSSCCSSCNAYQFPQKPPLKKNHGNSYSNSVRISPVLNVPPPYITKGSANFFGFGSFLRSGKDKKSKK
ncbi:hypothetical protein PTKIN_Ptkin05aG0136000 [Pterospermum kingtungense]